MATTWLTPRSFGTFASWFDWRFHSTLLDRSSSVAGPAGGGRGHRTSGR